MTVKLVMSLLAMTGSHGMFIFNILRQTDCSSLNSGPTEGCLVLLWPVLKIFTF